MRSSSVLLLSLALLACGGAPEPPAAPIVTLPVATVPPPPPPPPLPAEPDGLVALSVPPTVCAFAGALGPPGVDLTALAGGTAFGRASNGTVTLVFGEHESFAEVQTASWTVRGIASSDGARVHAARWLSFGGVLFAAASDR